MLPNNIPYQPSQWIFTMSSIHYFTSMDFYDDLSQIIESKRTDIHLFMSRGNYRRLKDHIRDQILSTNYFAESLNLNPERREEYNYKLNQYTITVKPFPGKQEAMVLGIGAYWDLSEITH